MQSSVWILPVGVQHSCDLCRGDVLVRAQHASQLLQQGVLCDAQVGLAQGCEHLEGAIGQLDVQVHAARADEGGVQLLRVVGGEDEDALRAAGGADAIRKVQQAPQRQLGLGGRPRSLSTSLS